MTKSGNVDNFEVNVRQGDEARQKVVNWLESWGCYVAPYDFDLDRYEGIDILATRKNPDKPITIDVKHDYSIARTGNVVFETWNRRGHLGWGVDPAHKNKYVIVVNGRSNDTQPEMWIFRSEDLKAYYAEFGHLLPKGRNESKPDEDHFVLMSLDRLRIYCGYWHVEPRKEPKWEGIHEKVWQL